MSEKKSRVCHFSSVHHINDTRVFYRECVWLAKEYDVSLVAIGKFTGKRDGVSVTGIPKPASRLKRIFGTTHQVYKVARSQHADLYHFHDPELIPFALLLKWSGKKVVYDIHENITESLKDKKWLMFKGLFTWLYLRFDALAARYFTLILAEESYLKVYKRRYPKKETSLVRNYAPSALLKPFVQLNRMVSGNKVKLFYMGSIDSLYCCKEMLEAVYLLNKQGIDAEITMVGWIEPNTQHEMQTWLFMKEIRHKVTMTGYMEIEQGYELSKGFHIGLSFVSDNLNVSQSLPRKMYEYMHIGLPVISSGHLLYKQLVETHALGLCVNNNTAVEISKAIKQLMESGAYLNQLAQNNVKAAATHFNWETEYGQLDRVYSQLLK
ncbi:MAG: glycosyltransferase [Bacteroidota bacterium]